MRATKIEMRTAALRGGRTVDGVWEAAGQLVATVYVVEPGAAEEIARRLGTPAEGQEEWVAEVMGPEEIE